MTKPNKLINLKNLLATASTVALMVGASNVMAADITTNDANTRTSTPAEWVGGTAPGADDTIILGGAHDITLNSGANVAFEILKLGANNGNSLTVGDDKAYSFISITHDAVEVIKVAYGNAGSLTIGDTGAAIGDVDFVNNAGTLTITTGDVGAVDSTVGGPAGTLVINGETKVGAIGTNNALTIVKIDADGALTASANIKATTLKFIGAGTVNLGAHTFTGAVDFNNQDGTIVMVGGTITGNVDSAAGANGTIKLDGGDGTIAGTFGDNFRVSAKFVTDHILNIGGASVNISGKTNTDNAGTLNLTNVGAIGLLGNIGLSGKALKLLQWTDQQTLTLDDSNIYVNTLDNAGNGNVGNNKFVVNGAVTLSVTDAGNTNGMRIIINDGKTLTLKGGKFDAKAHIDAANANNGTLAIDGAVTLNGVVGGANALSELDIHSGALTAGADIKATTLKFIGAGTVALANHTLTGNVDFDGKAGTITASTGTITGNIVDNGNHGTINFTGNGTIKGNVALGTLGTANTHTVTLSGMHTFSINATTGTGTITTDNVATLVGHFGKNNDVLTVVKLGGVTTLGSAGNGATIIAATFNGNQDVTVAVDSGIYAVDIHNNFIISDGKTLFLDNGSLNAGSILKGDGNGGTVVTTGDVKFGAAAVGGDGLALLNVSSGTLQTGGAFTVTATHVGGGATVTLGNNLSSNLQFEDNHGTVNLGAQTLTGNVNFNNKTSTIVMAGGTITGNVGSNGTIKLDGDGTIAGTFGDNFRVSAKFVTDHILNIGGASVNISGKTNTDNAGTLNLTNVGAIGLLGNIGLSGKALKLLQWTDQQTLTLDDSNIYVNTLDNAGNGNVGNNKFVVNGAVTLSVTDAGNTNGMRIIINDGKTLTLKGGKFDAKAHIDAANANNGTLAIDGAVTLNGVVGGANALSELDIHSGALTAGADIKATTLKFIGAGTVALANHTLIGNVDFNGQNGTVTVDNGGSITGAITTIAANTGTLTWNEGNLQQSIGAVGAALNTLNVANAGNVASNGNAIYAQTVNVKANEFALTTNDVLVGDSVIIANGAKFVVNSNALNAAVSGAGDIDLNILPTSANFAVNTTGALDITKALDLSKKYHAKSVSISEDINIKAGGDVAADTINIVTGKTLTHEAGALVANTYISGLGTFTSKIAGALTKIGNVGNSLAILNLQGVAGTKHNVSGDIYAARTSVDNKIETVLDADATFRGTMDVADGGIITLGVNTLTTTGDFTAGGNGLVINSEVNGANYGKIVANKVTLNGKNLTLNLSGTLKDGTTLNIFNNLDKSIVLTANMPSKLYTLKQLPNGAFLIETDKEKIDNTVVVMEAITPDKVVSAEMKEMMEGVNKLTGDASTFIQALSNLDLAIPEHASLAKEAEMRATLDNSSIAGDTLSSSLTETISVISSITTSSFSAPLVTAGVSSGDEDGLYRNGVWTQGFGSQNRQKLAKGNAGYRSTTLGGVIGVDSLVNDYFRIGIAAIHADSKVRMKDQKSGDKINTKSWLMSVYGTYEINSNLYGRAIATFGNTNVSTRDKKVVPIVGAPDTFSIGEYTSQSYSVDAALGYRHALSNHLAVTPEVGLRATIFNDGGYTQTNGNTNRTITKRAGSNYLAIAGATLTSNLMVGDAEFSPSIHGRILQDIGGKRPAVSSIMEGSFVTRTTKGKPLSKTTYQAGVDANLKYGIMEYGIGYEATIAKKYIGHSGSLKVRVNF